MLFINNIFGTKGEKLENGYEIKLDFKKDDNVIHIFSTLLELQEGLESFNKAITSSISDEIAVSSMLLDIEKSSIKTKIQDVVNKLPSEESLINFVDHPKDAVKEMLKDVLKGARKKLIEVVNSDLPQKEKENLLVNDIKENLESSELSNYGVKVSKDKILKAAENVCKPIRDSENDIYINTDDGFKKMNKNFKVNLSDTYKENIKTNIFRTNFIIKKPVLLGKSKWELVLDKTFEVEMLDEVFLNRIRNREQPILAGDMLDCEFKSVITYNEDLEVIESKYYVLRVYGVKTPDDEKLEFK